MQAGLLHGFVQNFLLAGAHGECTLCSLGASPQPLSKGEESLVLGTQEVFIKNKALFRSMLFITATWEMDGHDSLRIDSLAKISVI